MAIIVKPSDSDLQEPEPPEEVKESHAVIFATVLLLLVFMIIYFALKRYQPPVYVNSNSSATNGPAGGN